MADAVGGDAQGREACQVVDHLVGDPEREIPTPATSRNVAGHVDVPSAVCVDEIDELVRPAGGTVDTGPIRTHDRLKDQVSDDRTGRR
jgi:hypothetical protein